MASFDFSEFFDNEKASDHVIHVLPEYGSNKKENNDIVSRQSERLNKSKKRKLDDSTHLGLDNDEDAPGEGIKIHIPRNILAGHSKYFMTMFFRNFRESKEDVTVLKVHPIEIDVVYESLKCVFTNELPEGLSVKQLLGYLVIGDRYDLPVVINIVVQRIRDDLVLSLSDCMMMIDLPRSITAANFYVHIKKQVELKFAYTYRESWEMCTDQNLMMLTIPAWQIILEHEETRIRSENMVWALLCRWQEFEAGRNLDDLAPFIRFSQMWPNFILEVVERSQQFKYSERIQEAVIDARRFQNTNDTEFRNSMFPGKVFTARPNYRPLVHAIISFAESDVRDMFSGQSEACSTSILLFGVLFDVRFSRKDASNHTLEFNYPGVKNWLKLKFKIIFTHPVNIDSTLYTAATTGDCTVSVCVQENKLRFYSGKLTVILISYEENAWN